jgi:sensor domain CHASE-containing protein
MLRALRRVRARLLVEGQTGRYLLYAFGELVLVVIGILIALQLNTANEARIEQQEVRQYAQALVEDLKADQAMLQPILREMEDVRERVMRLSRYVQERPSS